MRLVFQDGVCDPLARTIHQTFRIDPVVKGSPLDRLHLLGIEDSVSHWSSVSGYEDMRSRSLMAFDRLTRRFRLPESHLVRTLLFVRLDVQFDLNIITNDLGSFDDFVPGQPEFAAFDRRRRIPAGENRTRLHAGSFTDQLSF